MSPEIENNIDWVAASSPVGEQVGPGLSRHRAASPVRTQRGGMDQHRAMDHRRGMDTHGSVTATQRGVMDTLLGRNNLAAHDERGNDPYNATGRQFRR